MSEGVRPGRRAAIVGGAGALLALGLFLALRPGPEVYRVFESPKGRYRIEVLRTRSLMPGMPGQGGDASGLVRLRDASGKLLRELAVEGPVSAIDTVRWPPDLVDIKLVAAWPLSPPDQ